MGDFGLGGKSHGISIGNHGGSAEEEELGGGGVGGGVPLGSGINDHGIHPWLLLDPLLASPSENREGEIVSVHF